MSRQLLDVDQLELLRHLRGDLGSEPALAGDADVLELRVEPAFVVRPAALTSETMDNAAAASETSRSVSASPAMIAAPLSKAFVAVEPRDASVARTR